MGYRQYLYSVDKDLVNRIRNCKSEQEFIDLIKKEKTEIISWGDPNDPDDPTYVPLYELGKKLYEFGKYYENSNDMYKHGDSLFMCDELNERYEDYGAIILDKDGIVCAMDWCQDRVIKIYEGLLDEDRSALLEHVRDYLRWWKYDPADRNLEHDRIVSSWLYEHEYFELVRIYKTFDFDKNAMMFMGW